MSQMFRFALFILLFNCYVNGFLKQNISKKTSYIVRQETTCHICTLNLRNEQKKVSLQEYSLGINGERMSQR